MTDKLRKNIKIILLLFVALFVVLIGYLGFAVTTYGERWFATPYNQRLTNAAGVVKAGSILDRNDVKLAYTSGSKREYYDDRSLRRAVAHVVGDNRGKSLGAETVYAKYLLGFDKDALERLNDAVSGADKKGSDVKLTIDAKLSKKIYSALGDNKGAAAVINYKTGEVLALVNNPSFDPYKLDEDEIEDTSLVNRATMGRYAPGSTMKIMTTAAALSTGVTDFEFECTGSCVIDGQKITCAEKHGTVNLEEAFTHSCNIYFAQLSVKLGNTTMMNTANSFAYNTEFNFSDVVLYSSQFELDGNKGNTAWAGVGLYNDLITPLHNAMISGAIANGGTMMEPKLLLKIGDKNAFSPTEYKRITTAAICNKLEGYMRKVVTSGTGTRANIADAKICGKTGTADYTAEGKTRSRAWFVGFIADDAEHPFALAVLLESAKSGGSSAAPIAKTAFAYLLDNY